MDNISQTFWMPEQCRMCTMDLSDECEYYSIDETLSDLVLTLTGILVCFAFCLLIFEEKLLKFNVFRSIKMIVVCPSVCV